MSFMLAVTGKGGTGKTTLSSSLVRLLMERGVRPVLAVDADPNDNLALLLGMETGETIGAIREEMLEKKAEMTGMPKERILQQKVEECVREGSGFDLVTMGRSEGPSCYCYVNNLLRSALASLGSNYRAVVVDNEAGMEHISRMNMNSVDCLLAVCEPTAVSARSAARILDLAGSLKIKVRRRVLAWNKVGKSGIPDAARKALGGRSFDAEVELPADERVGRLAALEESILNAEIPEEFGKLGDACFVGLSSEKKG